MKKDATLRARVPNHVADLISEESAKKGLFFVSDYIRQAVLEKLARDTKRTVESILKGN
jgi:hypothetical protein